MADVSASGDQLSSLLTKAEQLGVCDASQSCDVNPDPARTKTLTQTPGRIRFHQGRAWHFRARLWRTKRLEINKSCYKSENVSELSVLRKLSNVLMMSGVWAVCCGRDCTGARAELGHSSELGPWLAGVRLRLDSDWSVIGSLTGGWPSLSPRAGSSWLWSWTQLATVSHIDIISDQNNKTQGTPSDILLITQWYLIRLVIRLNTELSDWNIGDKTQWRGVRTILITTRGNLVYTKPANSFYWRGISPER